MVKEEKCIILDFMPGGYSDRRHAEPIAQAIGCSFFMLLELVPRESVTLKTEQEVYIGEGKRDEIKFIKGSLEYRSLTGMALSILTGVVKDLVKRNEAKFVEFFNTSSMLTPRMHKLQLLPGIGKKHLLDILSERKIKPFESFNDLTNRVKLFPDPVRSLSARVMQELEGNEKYCLFVLKQSKLA